MTLDKIQTALIILTCLVPGFIMYSTFSLFTIRRTETKDLLLLRFLTFSAGNLIVCLPLLYVVVTKNYIAQHPWLTTLAFLFMNFGMPVILGLVVGYFDQKCLLKHLLRRFGLNAMHSIPTAWDYKFNQISPTQGRWVLVTLKDDREIGGFFGGNSLASSEPTERDLYLEEAYAVQHDDQGNCMWSPMTRTDGILLRGDEIRSVSFYHEETPSGANQLGLKARLLSRLTVVRDGVLRRIHPQQTGMSTLQALPAPPSTGATPAASNGAVPIVHDQKDPTHV